MSWSRGTAAFWSEATTIDQVVALGAAAGCCARTSAAAPETKAFEKLVPRQTPQAPPGSVLITHGDDDINPIWYVHDVLKVRPDVAPIDRAWAGGRTWGLYEWDSSLWYLHRLRRQGLQAPLDVPAKAEARAALARDGYLVQLLERERQGRPHRPAPLGSVEQ